MNVELMKKVRERVLAEPHRVNMGNWITYKNKRAMRMLRKALGMSCKTTCCIAAHIIEVDGGDVPSYSQSLPGEIARVLSGITLTESAYLFYLHQLKWHRLGSPYRDLALRLSMFSPGTPEYAQVVAEAIDRCIERNGGAMPAEPPEEDEPKEAPRPDPDQIRASAWGVKLEEVYSAGSTGSRAR
jgi:hypothetical protein